MKQNIARLGQSAAILALFAVSAAASHGAVTQFKFLNGMNGTNEVPANASTGFATINVLSFDSAQGAFGVLTVNLTFSDLLSSATAAHVHGFSDFTMNSGVLAPLVRTAATSGTITGSWSPTSALQVDNLFNGLTYVNLHTSGFPGGEIRGQMVPIPEPAASAMLGLAVLGVLGRRRTRR
jgi:hypothetical protein